MKNVSSQLIINLRWRRRLFLIRVVMSSLNQQKELGELIRWAERRRLKNPLQLYRTRLIEVQERLFWLRRDHQTLVAGCKWFYLCGNVIFPRQKYHKQGSAAKYRRRK